MRIVRVNQIDSVKLFKARQYLLGAWADEGDYYVIDEDGSPTYKGTKSACEQQIKLSLDPITNLSFDNYKLYLAVLECKLKYYYPNEVHESWSMVPWPNDYIYDGWESKLKSLGLEIVGFPWNSYEGFVVWKLLSEEKRQTAYTELLF